jgi:ParB-like chromosome segregation protein Spo0J
MLLPSGSSIQAIDELVLPEWNPRTIADNDFKALVASIEHDPLFLLPRMPLVADGPVHNAGRIVYGGNQRVRALVVLYGRGWQPPLEAQAEGWIVGTVPVYVSDIPETTAWERALIDNNNAGTFDERRVNDLLRQLDQQGLSEDVALLGFVERDLERLEAGLPLMANEIRKAELSKPAPPTRAPAQDDPGKEYSNQYAVAVMCDDEVEQQRVFERLSSEGYQVKVLVV